jgi:hypothetical protein
VRGRRGPRGCRDGSGTVRKSLCRVLGATRPCQCLERSLTGLTQMASSLISLHLASRGFNTCGEAAVTSIYTVQTPA